MKILIISKYASPPKYSGVPSRLFYLSKEFINLGHKATLLTSDSNHLASYPLTKKTFNLEKIEGVPVYWIKTKKYQKTVSIKRVVSWFDFEFKLFRLSFKKLNLYRPDVVIVSSLSIFSIIYGFYLKKKLNCLLIFEIRDIWPLTMTEEGGFSKYHPLVLFIGFIEKFGYQKSDLIVGTMPKLDLHIRNILGYEKDFFCSPLGFNPCDHEEEIKKEKNPLLNIFPRDKFIVGYAGSMGITNALEPLIECIKLLRKNNKIHFILVGSGDLRERFEKQLSDYENVTFLKRIEQKQVKYFLNLCDILYLSTKKSKVWNYGQSMNKIIEYMLASRPIIASYSGFPSMINEANCGRFITTDKPEEIKDAILEFFNMPPKVREEFGARGREWIFKNRKYSQLAKEYINKIEKLYRGKIQDAHIVETP